MTYVRPHRRRDGTFVKGHNRRTRPRTAQPYAAPRRTPAPRPQPVHYGPTTYVRPYIRSDGTRVRGHHRSLSPRTAAVAAAGTGGGLLLILILVLMALAGGPGDNSKAPASTPPSHVASAAAHPIR